MWKIKYRLITKMVPIHHPSPIRMVSLLKRPAWLQVTVLRVRAYSKNDDMVIKLKDLKEVCTDFEKFARFCTTLAMRVSVREVCSSGYSCVRLNKDGDMTAGHRKRRKREPLISRSAMSSLPLSAHRTRQDANTSFSSLGNALGKTNKIFPVWLKQLVCYHDFTVHYFKIY